MRNFSPGSPASVKKIVGIPEAVLLNGAETLPGESPCVLVADSVRGLVWKVEPEVGKASIFAEVKEMKPPILGLPVGVNGIKIRDGYLYWTNSGQKLFCRIAIGDDGKPNGEAEIVKEDVFSDDFVFDDDGNAWLAQNVINMIGVLKKDGSVVTVAGKEDQLTVAGPTACKFGRGPDDKHILYVSTTGGIGAPIHGIEFEGAKLLAVDTKTFGM